jgi:ketosteroid isomerase-like protein
MFACGGEAAPPPQAPPPPPPAPAATADTTPAPAPAATAEAAPAAPAPSKTDKELAALKAIGDAMMAHDAAKVAAAYTTDAVVRMAGMPDRSGRDAIQAHMTEMWTASPDSKGAARRILVKDNMAVLEWTSTGTNTGPGPWGKATGKAWGINGASLIWFNDDGLIKEEHVYMDIPSMMGQLGVGKPGIGRPIATLPTNPPEIHIAKGDANEDANVAAAKSLNRAVEKGDATAFVAGMSDDVSYDDFTMKDPMNGQKAAQMYIDGWTKAFPGTKVTEGTIFGDEDLTADEYTTDATQKAAFKMGPVTAIPNTKKTMSTHTLEILQWKDGKLVHGWGYSNGLEMATQLGLVKPPKMKADAAKPDAAKPAAPANAKPATK